VVDYPKHEIMYDTIPREKLDRIRGHGFTLYGRLPDIPLDRARPIEEARYGRFDLIVVGNIHALFGAWLQVMIDLPNVPVVVLDGDDDASAFPYRGRYWRRPYLWVLPRARRRTMYFKREITPRTTSSRYFRLLPERLSARLPSDRALHPLAFSIPEDLVVESPPAKTQRFARHVVDPEVKSLLERRGPEGRPLSSDYGFDAEQAYFDDLRHSEFGVTMRRGGWDCLRHYEIAASGCVPCFRDLDQKPARCPPHGLDRSSCVVYRDAEDLLGQIDVMDPERYRTLQAGAIDWARRNTTERRATDFLASLVPVVGSSRR
jgi:hypothetical protein